MWTQQQELLKSQLLPLAFIPFAGVHRPLPEVLHPLCPCRSAVALATGLSNSCGSLKH